MVTDCWRKLVKASVRDVRDEQITEPVEGKANWAALRANPAIIVGRETTGKSGYSVAGSGDSCCPGRMYCDWDQ